jgi:DNA-binding response OmpR family regulator
VSLRVLIVEDDPEIAGFVTQGLREEGFVAEAVGDGDSAAHAVRPGGWDLVLLDIWLPGRDGLTVLRQIRAAGDATPVLLLTARDAVEDRVEGLNAGADDYLVKPFAFAELLARVHAILRRPPGLRSTRLVYADVTLDLAGQKAERAGRPLLLTAREQALLGHFLRHPDEVVSRTRIYEAVWDERYDGLSNTLEVHVMELRKKLEALGPRLIFTVRGKGYVLTTRTGEDAPA